MLLFSWDNLSTKGALHVAPDLLFVWNERQRSEAGELHGYPGEAGGGGGRATVRRVLHAAAPAWPRHAFFAPLGLDPLAAHAALCLLVALHRRARAAIRPPMAGGGRGRGRSHCAACNVIVRPHPDVALDDESAEPRPSHGTAMPRATGWVQRPFDDPGARRPADDLCHAAGLLRVPAPRGAPSSALNTSAELEAGIAGRPVLTRVVARSGRGRPSEHAALQLPAARARRLRRLRADNGGTHRRVGRAPWPLRRIPPPSGASSTRFCAPTASSPYHRSWRARSSIE